MDVNKSIKNGLLNFIALFHSYAYLFIYYFRSFSFFVVCLSDSPLNQVPLFVLIKIVNYDAVINKKELKIK